MLYHHDPNADRLVHIIDTDIINTKTKLIDLIQSHSINNDTFIHNIVFHDNVYSFFKRFKKSVSFAVLSIDSYQSTKFKLDSLYELLSNQGTIVVTNYYGGEHGQPIDEFVYDFELELYKNDSVAHIIKNIPDFEMPDDDGIDFGDLDAKIRELTTNPNSSSQLYYTTIIYNTNNIELSHGAIAITTTSIYESE